jgi:hypothetical protein
MKHIPCLDHYTHENVKSQKIGILMTIVHCHIWPQGTLCGSSYSQGTTCSTTSTVSGKRGLHGRGRMMMIHWSQPQWRPAASSCQLRCTSRMKIKEMLLCWPLASLPPSHSCHSCEDLKVGALGFNIPSQKLSRSVGWTEWKWASTVAGEFLFGIFLQRICWGRSFQTSGEPLHCSHSEAKDIDTVTTEVRDQAPEIDSRLLCLSKAPNPVVCHCQFLPFPFELAIMAYDKNRFDPFRGLHTLGMVSA